MAIEPEEQRLTEWHLHHGPYLGDISDLCFLHFLNHPLPLLLAGLDSEIPWYGLEFGKVMKSYSVFDVVRAHGISSSPESVIGAFGAKRVKLFSFSFENGDPGSPQVRMIHLLLKFNHWILDVCFLRGCLPCSNAESHFLALGCSDNSTQIWDISNSKYGSQGSITSTMLSVFNAIMGSQS